MDVGKLMEWKIKPGDTVIKGQSIATIETTKSTVEIESFRNGKVTELVGHPGDEIPVGHTIAKMDIEASTDDSSLKSVEKRIRLSPRARLLALENNVDLSKIKASREDGLIEIQDIEKFLSIPHQPPSQGRNLRLAIAKAMTRSKSEIPHYYLKSEFNLNHFMKWLDHKNLSTPPEDRTMVQSALLKAIVLSLKKCPQMNGTYMNGSFSPHQSIHLGVAISLKSEGVIVPAILEADKMSLNELNKSFQNLIVRTQKNELKNRELTEGTITVTNLGDLGSDEVFGIIFPPQVALLGLGKIHKKPVIEGDKIVSGFVINVTLSADHRVTDGLMGARFLSEIENNILHPELLEDKR
jgi:pyruvate dehydrogenase E2 component (dihydrolipoamide acetyltransferase)